MAITQMDYTGGSETLNPLVLMVRSQVLGNSYLQQYIPQSILKKYKKIRTLSSADATTYLPTTGQYVTDTSISFKINNSVTEYTLTTTGLDLTSMTIDETKQASLMLSVSQNAWRAFCVMLYND